jgi:hypothetical protein
MSTSVMADDAELSQLRIEGEGQVLDPNRRQLVHLKSPL